MCLPLLLNLEVPIHTYLVQISTRSDQRLINGQKTQVDVSFSLLQMEELLRRIKLLLAVMAKTQ